MLTLHGYLINTGLQPGAIRTGIVPAVSTAYRFPIGAQRPNAGWSCAPGRL